MFIFTGKHDFRCRIAIFNEQSDANHAPGYGIQRAFLLTGVQSHGFDIEDHRAAVWRNLTPSNLPI